MYQYQHQNPGAHWKIVPPAGPLLLWAMKRGGPRQGGEKIVIGHCEDSFLRVMDREAVARMSGRHHGWTSLTNEGLHLWFVGVSSVHPGQMVTEINFKFCKELKGDRDHFSSTQHYYIR